MVGWGECNTNVMSCHAATSPVGSTYLSRSTAVAEPAVPPRSPATPAGHSPLSSAGNSAVNSRKFLSSFPRSILSAALSRTLKMAWVAHALLMTCRRGAGRRQPRGEAVLPGAQAMAAAQGGSQLLKAALPRLGACASPLRSPQQRSPASQT